MIWIVRNDFEPDVLQSTTHTSVGPSLLPQHGSIRWPVHNTCFSAYLHVMNDGDLVKDACSSRSTNAVSFTIHPNYTDAGHVASWPQIKRPIREQYIVSVENYTILRAASKNDSQ